MLVVGEKVGSIEERSVQVFCHRTKSRRSSNTLADSLSDRLWRERMVTMMGMEVASTYDDVECVDDADVSDTKYIMAVVANVMVNVRVDYNWW